MSEWYIALAKDFCLEVKDGTHDSPKRSDVGYPLITSKHLKNGQILLDQAYCISQNDYYKINKRSKVDKWDVLMSMIGTVGEVCLVKENPIFAIKNMALFKCGNELTAKWLYYYLISDLGKKKLKEKMSGSSQSFISLGDLRNLEILCPPEHIRDRLVSVINAYDNLIENNNRRIVILEEMAQRFYREWFLNFRYPGHESTKMLESELGMIPAGWNLGKVDDICEKIFSGGTPSTTIEAYWNGELPWLSSGETRNSFITETEKSITAQGVENSSARKAEYKDVVVASAGQGKTRGQTSFLLINTYINQSVIALRGKTDYSEYLYFNIKSRYSELRNASDSSSIRGSITTALMGNLDIIVPDERVVGLFSRQMSLLIKQIGILLRKNTTLNKTRDMLLPRLISGDIDVSNIDIPIFEVSE